ncbi:hypothetical protein F4779DRAFT_406232 [Xylariaceae sp. FL0662B]|nr:hypothetical protein F4779DRAFT_406232 [Xylariaceae sp. FL0662B]
MSTATKGAFRSFLDFIPCFKSNEDIMDDKFQATDNFKHRYQDPKVLRKKLEEFGFKKEEIKLRTTQRDGLQAQLPRPITREQREAVFTAFDKAQREQLALAERDEDSSD